MFRSLSELFGYTLQAKDGEIGQVHDFYFDDEEAWVTRYLVIDTGLWIFGRKVLISPNALGQPNWTTQSLPVDLTREQVKESPDMNTALPISRRQQIALHEYYRWPVYWNSATPFSTPIASGAATLLKEQTPDNDGQNGKREMMERLLQQNATLRSAKEVIGYAVSGDDGELGQIDDIILDDQTWKFIYIVLDTSTWLSKGKKTLIAIPWIQWISHKDQEIQLELSQQTIADSPPYNPETPINHSYEEVLYDYHGKPYLWTHK
jgi:sporulation protein YlmC with PRC-barrel domain